MGAAEETFEATKIDCIKRCRDTPKCMGCSYKPTISKCFLTFEANDQLVDEAGTFSYKCRNECKCKNPDAKNAKQCQFLGTNVGDVCSSRSKSSCQSQPEC